MTRCMTVLLWVVLLGSSAAADRPNVLVVLADDLGYGDIGCYGRDSIETPNLDRFALEGLRLTSCYSAHPNCSPSRAGLMTGRTPFRLGIYNWIPMFSPMHVMQSEITVATLLRDVGYDTCHVGKWHLNGEFNLPTQPQPSDHGFNHWFATQNNALPNHRDPFNFVRNGEAVGPLKGYSATIVAREAVDWLSRGRDQSKPFFMFACFHEPHEPIASAPRFSSHYPSEDPSYSAHHGNVTQLDDGFGQLLNALDRLDLTRKTFVFFTSDNGPAITAMHPHGSSGPLRDKKGSLYEGGIRVPGIVRWPGHVEPGTTSDVPVSGVDLLPTLCHLAGVPLPEDRPYDGTSFLPMLSGKPFQRSQPLYWQFNRAKSDAKVAVRDGDWKLVASLTDPGPNVGADITTSEINRIKSAELTRFELYNLRDDIDESEDLANKEFEVFREMQRQMRAIYASVREDAPRWPAWEWPRYESGKIEWPDYWVNRKRSK